MDWNYIYYLLFGFISGLGELLPVSSASHDYLLQLLTQFDTRHPALQMAIHVGCFGAILIQYFRRLAHMRREYRIAAMPQQKRKRQPDMMAVMDAKVMLVALIPILLAVLLSEKAYARLASLPILCLLLVLSGVLLYIPQFLPGANKDSRSLSRKDSLILGLSAGLGMIPGFSGVGSTISVGLIKGCDRSYIMDIAMLAMLPLLLGCAVMDGIVLFASGIVVQTVFWIYCVIAAVAAFGGAWIAFAIMRYLSMKSNIHSFAYYNWGLGLFGFLVYLMI